MQNVRTDRHAQKERRKLMDFNEVEKKLAQELRQLEQKDTNARGVRSAMLEQERDDNRFLQLLSELMAEYSLDDAIVREILLAFHGKELQKT